jgi:hypothetical protein
MTKPETPIPDAGAAPLGRRVATLVSLVLLAMTLADF